MFLFRHKDMPCGYELGAGGYELGDVCDAMTLVVPLNRASCSLRAGWECVTNICVRQFFESSAQSA